MEEIEVRSFFKIFSAFFITISLLCYVTNHSQKETNDLCHFGRTRLLPSFGVANYDDIIVQSFIIRLAAFDFSTFNSPLKNCSRIVKFIVIILLVIIIIISVIIYIVIIIESAVRGLAWSYGWSPSYTRFVNCCIHM